ncbi:MAG: hypothetical protein H0W30_17820 [Gemmatimonadaceae bacterium]|nr:hypothetical protein [Gemmatimonadaceae bacterium]
MTRHRAAWCQRCHLTCEIPTRAACAVAGDVSAALGHSCGAHLLFAEGKYAAPVDTLRHEGEPSP